MAQVVDYSTESSTRLFWGVGFGPNFMRDSGTAVYLLGAEAAAERDIRSPHNYILGTLARLGIVGSAIAAGIGLHSLSLVWRLRRDSFTDDLAFVASLIIIVLLPAALVGVILESPFGAIPFFWSLGVLVAYRAIWQGQRSRRIAGARA